MEDAAQYASRTEWNKSNASAYNSAHRNGWLDEVCAHMTSGNKPKGYWTLERCMQSAAGFERPVDWQDADGSAYVTARVKGWLSQCTAHMTGGIKPRGYWTLERCMEEAAQYTSPVEWFNNSTSGFSTAHRNGWLEKCEAHMVSDTKPRGHWTLDNCLEDASRYGSRSDWKRGSSGAYTVAARNGWLDQCCEHMERAGGTDNDVVYIWRDAGSDLHKVGVTSARIGEQRVSGCGSHNGMDPRIVLMLKVDDARAVESKLLELGTDPELDSSIDGYTEFRRLTDAQLGQAVSIAYEAALAA
jgi:hypothetical protein